MIEPYKYKCSNPGCNKSVLTYNSKKGAFCSRACETNYTYLKKFSGQPEEKKPTWDEVKRIGVR